MERLWRPIELLKRFWLWTWAWLLRPSPESGPEAEEFSRYVAAASALLDFLIKEGLQPIRDQIIDDIEAARALLKDGTPSKEDRAKLLKAYRDLSLVPRITITSARIPPTTFWSVESQWPGLVIWVSVIPSIILLIGQWHWSALDEWYWAVIYLLLSVLVISGLYVFSGTVTNNKLNQIIRFCYVLTGFALVGSLLPFALPGLFSNLDISSKAPLGILQGCVRADGKVKQAYPEEVQCDVGDVQWVVRLGGTVKAICSSKANCPSSDSDKAGAPPVDNKAGAPPADNKAAAPPAPGGTATFPPSRDKDAQLMGQINGGLVVPLYVIVLALFGGAISMTRRVPEYQRRAMDSHDALTNAEARENLVFQIMQVATAPLIAVTTYYIILPDTPLKSVVLGFGSGFASEPILLMIRALVDKLKPATAAAQPDSSAISVTMTPPSATVPPRGAMQFAAKVSGSSNTQLLWLIDPPDTSSGTISQSGYYVAPDSTPTKGVTITARSMADSTKSATASVKVEPIVTVTPASATLGPGASRQFSAEVLGLSGPEVNWSIEPAEGQMANGLYTAPPTIGATRAVTVIARSRADATRFGSAKVTLAP